MVNGIVNSIQRVWLDEDYVGTKGGKTGKRSLWVKDKTGNIQLIERSKYSWFKHTARFSAILETMSRELTTLSKTIERNEINTIVSLDKEVDRRYEKYRKGHCKIYLFIFAHYLDKRYKEFKASIYSNLKKQLSSLSEEDFGKIIKVLPLSEIDLNDLKPEQLSKVFDEKIKNFDSLNEKEKTVLFNNPQKMSDEQFTRLLDHGVPFKSFNLAFLSEFKKRILINLLFIRKIYTASQDDLQVVFSLASFMTKDRLNQLIDNLDFKRIDVSQLSPEQMALFLEKRKLSINKLSIEAINRMGRLCPVNYLGILSTERCRNLDLSCFSPSQIIYIIARLSQEQKKSIDISAWTSQEITQLYNVCNLTSYFSKEELEHQLEKSDLNNWPVTDVVNLIYNCNYYHRIKINGSNWSEKLFKETYYNFKPYDILDFSNINLQNWSYNSVNLLFDYFPITSWSLEVLLKNFSFIPGANLAKLSTSQLSGMSLDHLSYDSVLKLFEHALDSTISVLSTETLLRNIQKIPHLHKLSYSQLIYIDFSQLTFNQIMSLNNRVDYYQHHLRNIALSNFFTHEISQLFDTFGVTSFRVAGALHRIDRKYYKDFSFSQCGEIDYSFLSDEQKKAFSKTQRSGMKNYKASHPFEQSTSGGSYGGGYSGSSSSGTHWDNGGYTSGGSSGGNYWNNGGYSGGGSSNGNFGGSSNNNWGFGSSAGSNLGSGYLTAESLTTAKPHCRSYATNINSALAEIQKRPNFAFVGERADDYNRIRNLILTKRFNLTPAEIFNLKSFGKLSLAFHSDKLGGQDSATLAEADAIYKLLTEAKDLITKY